MLSNIYANYITIYIIVSYIAIDSQNKCRKGGLSARFAGQVWFFFDASVRMAAIYPNKVEGHLMLTHLNRSFDQSRNFGALQVEHV
jgi:hypothetical protein